MRKPFLAIVAVTALLFVNGCGQSGDSDAADDPTTTAAASDDTSDDKGDDKGDDKATTTTGSDEPSGDLVSVDKWATEFCGNFEGWLDAVKAAGESVGAGLTPGDIEGAKTAIVGLFDNVASETNDLIGAIEQGGAPDIDNGEDFLDELLAKFEAFHSAIASASSDAKAVSTSDPAEFEAKITELVSTFQTETEAVGNSFAELDALYPDEDFQDAMSDACTFIDAA